MADSDPGDSVSYTPTDDLNDCVEQAAVLKGSVKLDPKSGGSSPTVESAQITAIAFTGLDGETVAVFFALGVGSVVVGAVLFARHRRASR